MSARTKARKRALDVLFESELRSLPLGSTLADRLAAPDASVHPYTITLVEGVGRNQARIDEILSDYSQGWGLDRMPAVDRNLMRVGVFELLWCEDVPDAVAISEAVYLASELSTEQSPAFVNGLLARVAALKPVLAG